MENYVNAESEDDATLVVVKAVLNDRPGQLNIEHQPSWWRGQPS